MKHVMTVAAVLIATAALGGCDRLRAGWDAASAPQTPVAEAPAGAPAAPGVPNAPAAPNGKPGVAAGPAHTVQPTSDMGVHHAASVVRLDMLSKQSEPAAKLFGTAGGDPAMNGLLTEIAFFKSSAEGWTVFRVGDFLDYRIVSEAPGRVDLEIEESTMDEATGQFGRRTRRLIVAWTPNTDETPPAVITITPAR